LDDDLTLPVFRPAPATTAADKTDEKRNG
jgi:hypothetical protein